MGKVVQKRGGIGTVKGRVMVVEGRFFYASRSHVYNNHLNIFTISDGGFVWNRGWIGASGGREVVQISHRSVSLLHVTTYTKTSRTKEGQLNEKCGMRLKVGKGGRGWKRFCRWSTRIDVNNFKCILLTSFVCVPKGGTSENICVCRIASVDCEYVCLMVIIVSRLLNVYITMSKRKWDKSTGIRKTYSWTPL